VAKDTPAISDEALADLASAYMRVVDRFDYMERYVSREILRQMIDLKPLRSADLADKGKLQTFADALAEQLNADVEGPSRYVASTAETAEGIAIDLKRRVHGNDHTSRIDPTFLASADYQMIADFANQTD